MGALRARTAYEVAQRLAVYAGALACAIFVLVPFWWTLTMSLKNARAVTAIPPRILFHPSLANYAALFSHQAFSAVAQSRVDFSRVLGNSLIESGAAVAISLLLGFPCAYALARMRFRWRENVAVTILSFYFAPPLALALPLFEIYQALHLYNTLPGMILVDQLICLPLIIWVLRSYFEEVPIEIEEAAKIDGCTIGQLLRRVLWPITRPAVAATATLAFIFCWNNFLFGYLLSGNQTEPIATAAISFISYQQVLWGQMSAAAILAVIPEFILALLTQRYLVRGLSFGAIQ